MPEMRVMESRLAIVPTLPFCGLPNVNRVGDRESRSGDQGSLPEALRVSQG